MIFEEEPKKAQVDRPGLSIMQGLAPLFITSILPKNVLLKKVLSAVH